MKKLGYGVIFGASALSVGKLICCVVVLTTIFAVTLSYYGSSRLLRMRSVWVASQNQEFSNVRNSLHAGRPGTRNNIRRPQVRWSEGVVLAKQVLQSRTIAQRGSNSITIGTITREAVQRSRAFIEEQFEAL